MAISYDVCVYIAYDHLAISFGYKLGHNIVRQPQGYHAVIVLSSQPPYINHTITLRLRKSQGVGTLTMQLLYNYVHGFKRPSMFIFGCTFELCFKVIGRQIVL